MKTFPPPHCLSLPPPTQRETKGKDGRNGIVLLQKPFAACRPGAACMPVPASSPACHGEAFIMPLVSNGLIRLRKPGATLCSSHHKFSSSNWPLSSPPPQKQLRLFQHQFCPFDVPPILLPFLAFHQLLAASLSLSLLARQVGDPFPELGWEDILGEMGFLELLE